MRGRADDGVAGAERLASDRGTGTFAGPHPVAGNCACVCCRRETAIVGQARRAAPVTTANSVMAIWSGSVTVFSTAADRAATRAGSVPAGLVSLEAKQPRPQPTPRRSAKGSDRTSWSCRGRPPCAWSRPSPGGRDKAANPRLMALGAMAKGRQASGSNLRAGHAGGAERRGCVDLGPTPCEFFLTFPLLEPPSHRGTLTPAPGGSHGPF